MDPTIWQSRVSVRRFINFRTQQKENDVFSENQQQSDQRQQRGGGHGGHGGAQGSGYRRAPHGSRQHYRGTVRHHQQVAPHSAPLETHNRLDHAGFRESVSH